MPRLDLSGNSGRLATGKAPLAGAASLPEKRESPAPANHPVVALLAEDNPADVVIVKEAIAAYGLPIVLHVVSDGEEAVQFVERAELDSQAPCPQLLLLDLNLPKLSGQEVLQRVRSSPKCKNIPVLILTSSDAARDRTSVARLGASRYFRKPSSYEEFLKVGEVLQSLLEQV